jgi:hypothetical protein
MHGSVPILRGTGRQLLLPHLRGVPQEEPKLGGPNIGVRRHWPGHQLCW